MAKRLYGARRHIKEWTGFFRGTKAMTEELVEIFIKQHQKNKHFKQSLRRLIANGIIQKKDRKFIVTPKGFIFFLKKPPKNNLLKKWDGKWRLVGFDVPVCYNNKRQQLRFLLKRFNFYPLQKSLYVCPSHMSEEFWKLAIEYELDKYCKIMLVDIIEENEELRKFFKLPIAHN